MDTSKQIAAALEIITNDKVNHWKLEQESKGEGTFLAPTLTTRYNLGPQCMEAIAETCKRHGCRYSLTATTVGTTAMGTPIAALSFSIHRI